MVAVGGGRFLMSKGPMYSQSIQKGGWTREYLAEVEDGKGGGLITVRQKRISTRRWKFRLGEEIVTSWSLAT